MKIKELLNSGKVMISCEIFPPKVDADFEKVERAAKEIAALSPSYISVTYGASGGISSHTVEIASKVQNEWGVTALAHLTCASSTREKVADVIEELKAHGIENILALRGDIPKDADFPLPNQYRYASELIREIREKGDFCVGGACYPEGHVECEHMADDIGHLKEKVEIGCDFLTTQMFFDNNVYYNFLYRILQQNIRVPVVAGIMPVTNGRQIKRITELSGTSLPARFRAIVDKFGDNPKAMKQAGIAYATEQIIDLIANGVTAVHIYTMNKPDVAGSILGNLSEIIGK
ncbi:MAG TPA: methylenetetrahydrofolate reductase [NAD(P)H] [Firmicutes bacterium]|nr:methylenetetrahydrofolate reductase [NAD(P)H] [Bacillota bacterium]